MSNPMTPHPAAETSGRTFTNDGITYCAECCNGDRCDDPTHGSRKNCRYCGGTGRIQKVTAAETRGTVEEFRRLRAICETSRQRGDWHVAERQEFDHYAYEHSLSLISQLEREKEELMETLADALMYIKSLPKTKVKRQARRIEEIEQLLARLKGGR